MTDVHAPLRPHEAPQVDTRVAREPTLAIAARSPARRAATPAVVPSVGGAAMSGLVGRAHRVVPSDATLADPTPISDTGRIRPSDARVDQHEFQATTGPVDRIQRTTVIRRDDVDAPVRPAPVVPPAPQRATYEQRLDAMVNDVGERVDEERAKILAYLSKGLSVGGTNVFRSSEVRGFRERMKTAARDQRRVRVRAVLQLVRADARRLERR